MDDGMKTVYCYELNTTDTRSEVATVEMPITTTIRTLVQINDSILKKLQNIKSSKKSKEKNY